MGKQGSTTSNPNDLRGLAAHDQLQGDEDRRRVEARNREWERIRREGEEFGRELRRRAKRMEWYR